MKKRCLALTLTAALLLTGCSSLLNRDFVSVTAHSTAPLSEGDPSTLRAENYQELVNALLYFITVGAESGTIRLYTDWENVEENLEAACLEVANEDPLGAYAVEFIKYSVSPLVTYSEAEVQITYRRSREQISSIVSATGVTAIRGELTEALASFAPECVLRIGYFDQDENFILSLARQAYYDAPMSALDFPDVEIAQYPDHGRQRIVELNLTYHLSPDQLQARQAALTEAVQTMGRTVPFSSGPDYVHACAVTLLSAVKPDPAGGPTAWHAFAEGSANSEGIALAFAALCQHLHIPCQVAEGTLKGTPHFWNVVSTGGGWRHMDLNYPLGSDPFRMDVQMNEAGYLWDPGTLPRCTPAALTD